jgi:polysaccharide export outer membrane protein
MTRKLSAFLFFAAILSGAFPVCAQADRGYILKANDLIRITVYQEDDMTTETRISKSGHIVFPLLGSLSLEGKSVDASVKEITAALDRDYIINPQVTLTVLEYAKQRVTVLGQVQKPGTLEIPDEGRLDLLGAIAMAGGYTRIADPGNITVRRKVANEDKVYRINAKKLASDKEAKPFMIQPDDVINVGESLF